MTLPLWPGWHLVGAYPDGEPDDVGSWLLTDRGAALLLEVPEGLPVAAVRAALDRTGATLRYVTASHDHEDHLDWDAWQALGRAFPDAGRLHPNDVRRGDTRVQLGGEPVWLIRAPKHSASDVVAVFRGVAMTGDIELGQLASVNDEVPAATKRRSMAWLAGFQDRTGYRVHTVVSAHLNDLRQGVHWPDLFRLPPR